MSLCCSQLAMAAALRENLLGRVVRCGQGQGLRALPLVLTGSQQVCDPPWTQAVCCDRSCRLYPSPLSPERRELLGTVTQKVTGLWDTWNAAIHALICVPVHHLLSDPGLWVDLGKDGTLLLALLLWKLLNSQECC